MLTGLLALSWVALSDTKPAVAVSHDGAGPWAVLVQDGAGWTTHRYGTVPAKFTFLVAANSEVCIKVVTTEYTTEAVCVQTDNSSVFDLGTL